MARLRTVHESIEKLKFVHDQSEPPGPPIQVLDKDFVQPTVQKTHVQVSAKGSRFAG